MGDPILKDAGRVPRNRTVRDVIRTVTSLDFRDQVLNTNGPVVVEFMSYGCMHCRAIEPALQKVAVRLQSKVKIYRVNVPVEPELAESYGIVGTPTFVMFLDGSEVSRVEGPRPIESSLLATLTKPFEA